MKALRLLILLILAVPVFAQDIPVDINNISDQQLAQIMLKYKLHGLAPQEVEQLLKEKGVPGDQIIVLNRRIASLDPLSGKSEIGYRSKTSEEITVPRKSVVMYAPAGTPGTSSLRIFGSEIFENQNLSFEPNLSISTPRNYVLGVGDELIVDIYGLSESTKKLKVSTEGYIRFPNLGPIKVSGLTIEEA